MEVILLEKIERLGALGDVVRVRAGYARNYLIPMGKAKFATEENMAEVQARREELERKALAALSEAEQRKARLDGLQITIQVETNQDGKLFGSVGAGEISRAVTETGVALERQEIRLPDGPLRELGEHAVTVHIHTDVEAVVQVVVESGTVIETPVELAEEMAEETVEETATATPEAEVEVETEAEEETEAPEKPEATS